MKKISKLIFITSLISGIIFAQDDFKRVGKSGFGFLKISPSARAAGMGDAFTAIADDVTTNVAGSTVAAKYIHSDITGIATDAIVCAAVHS